LNCNLRKLYIQFVLKPLGCFFQKEHTSAKQNGLFLRFELTIHTLSSSHVLLPLFAVTTIIQAPKSITFVSAHLLGTYRHAPPPPPSVTRSVSRLVPSCSALPLPPPQLIQNLAPLLKHQARLGPKNEGPNVSVMHIQPGAKQSELITPHLGSERTRCLLPGGCQPSAINLQGRSLLDHNTQPVMSHCFINTVLESL